ncbi:AGE family epimerase/isomerase, partial [Pseudomonas fluorescens]|nr:AGE family epimerase/isomerase [Pseudomonas fluorescens]
MADEGIIATDEAADVVARLKRRMIDEALPLWSTVGWNRDAGGFVDRLHRDGTADMAAPRRVLVQARQIYCYAKAAQMGWYPEGRGIALKGLEHLLARAKAPDGRPGYVHQLTPDGAVLDGRR